MKKEIDSKLKEIEKTNKKLYARIFTVSGLKQNDNYHHITYDDIICERVDNNDLALLGDNVLKLIFSFYLYDKKYSSSDNKNIEITKKKEILENNNRFSEIAKIIDLKKYYIKLFSNHIYNLQKNDMATFLEAVIGAFYLYFGFEVVKEFILKNIKYFTDN